MSKCPNCSDNEEVITLLSYALKGAEKDGHELDSLAAGFVHGWLEESERLARRELSQEQDKMYRYEYKRQEAGDDPKDRTVLNWVLFGCFVVGLVFLGLLFSGLLGG